MEDQSSNQGNPQNQSAPTQSSVPSTPVTSTPQATEGNNQMLMGILAYIGILVLIPLLVEKNDPFVKYHVRQGLVLFVVEIAIWVIGSMLMLYMVIPLLQLGVLVLSILGIVNVVQKKMEPVPLVGQFSKYFDKV